jgi:fused signal recognition particle receptor
MLGWFKRKFGKKPVEPTESGEQQAELQTEAEAAAESAPVAEAEATAVALTPPAEAEAPAGTEEAEPGRTEEPEPEAVIASEPEPEVVIEPEPEAEPEPAAAEKPEALIEPEPMAVAEAEPEPEPEAVIEPEPAAEAEAEPEAVIVPESVAAAEAEPETVTEPEPVVIAAPEAETVSEPEPMIEPEPVAAEEPEPEAVIEPESEPEVVVQPEPVEPETVIEPEPATVAEAVMEPEPEEVEDEPEAIVPAPPISGRTQEKPAARSMFQRLQERLGKTRDALIYRLDRLFLGKKEIDQDLYEQLEEILITADLGVATTLELIDAARKKVKRDQLSDPQALKDIIRDQILAYIEATDQPAELVLPEEGPFVIMVVGVNGVGKTTTIGKIAAKFVRSGQSVLLVAADTFRAAAIDQLRIWGERVGVRVIAQKPNADPSSVVFDGLEYGAAHGVDVIIIDTAGRLHTSVNLMAELKKIKRVIGKKMEGAPHEVMLVLDATTGQNGIAQAKMFHEAVGVTGLTLTKLDGTAKGGIVANVCREIRIPVRFIGIGEQLDDLRDFDAREFVEALFAGQTGGAAAGP